MNLYKQFSLDPPDPTEPEIICKDYKSDDLYFDFELRRSQGEGNHRNESDGT